MNQCKQCGHELPEPLPGFCTFCGAATSETPGIVTPIGAGSSGSSPQYYCPWEDRARLGFFKAFWETLKSVMTQPTEFYQKLNPKENAGSAIGFAVLSGTIAVIFSILWQIPFQMLNFATMGTRNPGAAAIPMVFTIGMLFVYMIFSPLLVLIGLFITTAITHFTLWIVGGANKSFETTLRVVGYAMGISTLCVIPFCGGMIAGIWQIVVEIIGLKEVHDTTFGKAIAAKLIPMFVCCCCMIGIFALIFSMVGLSLSNPDGIRQFFEHLSNR